MDRTITVDGVGRLNIPPDLVILYTTLETRETKYSNAVHLAQEKEEELREAIARAGFDPDDLKTASFRVEPIKNEKKDRFGTKSQVVGGFACYHLFKLMFDFDQDRLSKVISQITRSELKPNFSVKYSVQRANFVKDELMRDAVANAQHKAYVFADAAGCKVGKMIDLKYEWEKFSLASKTNYFMEDRTYHIAPEGQEDIPVIPEDIRLQMIISATFELVDAE